jgi:hypothetical protein
MKKLEELDLELAMWEEALRCAQGKVAHYTVLAAITPSSERSAYYRSQAVEWDLRADRYSKLVLNS